MQYKMINNSEYIIRLNDDSSISCIPNDPDNSDWQQYQKWLLELDEFGNPNQPLPAE